MLQLIKILNSCGRISTIVATFALSILLVACGGQSGQVTNVDKQKVEQPTASPIAITTTEQPAIPLPELFSNDTLSFNYPKEWVIKQTSPKFINISSTENITDARVHSKDAKDHLKLGEVYLQLSYGTDSMFNVRYGYPNNLKGTVDRFTVYSGSTQFPQPEIVKIGDREVARASLPVRLASDGTLYTVMLGELPVGITIFPVEGTDIKENYPLVEAIIKTLHTTSAEATEAPSPAPLSLTRTIENSRFSVMVPSDWDGRDDKRGILDLIALGTDNSAVLEVFVDVGNDSLKQSFKLKDDLDTKKGSKAVLETLLDSVSEALGNDVVSAAKSSIKEITVNGKPAAIAKLPKEQAFIVIDLGSGVVAAINANPRKDIVFRDNYLGDVLAIAGTITVK